MVKYYFITFEFVLKNASTHTHGFTFSLKGPAAPYPGLQQYKGAGARTHFSRLQP